MNKDELTWEKVRKKLNFTLEEENEIKLEKEIMQNINEKKYTH